MGGRANPLRDAAAMTGIGRTGCARHIDRSEAQLAVVAVVAARRGTSTSPVVGRAA